MAIATGKLSEQIVVVEDAISLVTTPLDHARIHKGQVWAKAAALAALNDNATYVLHVKTPSGINEIHALFAFAASGAGYVRLYEGPTKTDNGTEITSTVVNHNRITAQQVALGTKLYHTPTTSANGTLLAEFYMGSGNKGAGEVDRTNEWVLAPNTSYLIIFESDAAANVMSYSIVLYEK